MAERSTAASRPEPSQRAAVARALKLCWTQPSAFPGVPSSPASPEAGEPEGPRGEGRHLPLTALYRARTTTGQDDRWRRETSNRCSEALVPEVSR